MQLNPGSTESCPKRGGIRLAFAGRRPNARACQRSEGAFDCKRFFAARFTVRDAGEHESVARAGRCPMRQPSQNICDCCSRSPQAKWKIGPMKPRRWPRKRLLERRRRCSAHWSGSRPPDGSSYELGLPSFTPIVQRFTELLQKCKLVLPGEADRRRLQEASRDSQNSPTCSSPDLMARIGRIGFSCAGRSRSRKTHRRDRRTPRKSVRGRSLLDRFVGRNLRRSETGRQKHAGDGRFAFQRSGNARRHGNGEARRFSHRDECVRTSGSDRTAMCALSGR